MTEQNEEGSGEIDPQIQFQMAVEVNVHEVVGFIRGLNEEQMKQLRMIFVRLSHEPELAPYYIGILSTELDHQYGVCLGCGRKHGEEIEELLSDLTMNDSAQSWSNFVRTMPDETVNQLNEYHLTLVKQSWPKVVCTGCGMGYESLKDRMLRGPDECSGCHQKAKFG